MSLSMHKCNRPGHCGNYTLFGPLKGTPGRHGYSRLGCGRYNCPSCGPRKLRKARKAIARIAEQKRLTRFVTLTLDPNKIPMESCSEPGAARGLEYLRETWRKMRVSLKRHVGKSVQFVSIVQPHKSGVVHLHLLVGVYLDQGWLSDAWSAIGGGKIVDIRWVDLHRVAGYLSRYLAGSRQKGGGVDQLPAGVHRFSCSRGIVLWPKNAEPSGWAFSKISIVFARLAAPDVSDEHFEPGERGPRLMFFAGPPGLAPPSPSRAQFLAYRRWLRTLDAQNPASCAETPQVPAQSGELPRTATGTPTVPQREG